MPTITYEKFSGKDLRRLASRSDMATCRVATNLDLTTGGGYRTRDGLVKVTDLHEESVGLYTIGGFLRSVVPGGQDIQDPQNPYVLYDPIGKGIAYPLDDIVKLHSAQPIGASAVAGVFPYIGIEREVGTIEHHWIREFPLDAGDVVNSFIPLTFVAGTPLVKMKNRMWAADQINGVVRFTAIGGGPSDWLTADDAGFLPVLQHASGTRQITGLSYYNELLAVFFGESIQLYSVPADPDQHILVKTLDGPGSTSPNTVRNVLGDLYYLSHGGFRALSVANSVGEFREGDIGARIQEETAQLSLTPTPVALWSQTRSQYLCAFGTTVEVYTFSPLGKINGWTKWELPVEVEYMVELDGVLYIRSEDSVYKFDPTVDTDLGVKIPFAWTSQFTDAKDYDRYKMFDSIALAQSGRCAIKYLVDPRNLNTFVGGPTINGDTSSLDAIGCDVTTKELALQITGTGAWRFDAFGFRYRTLQGA